MVSAYRHLIVLVVGALLVALSASPAAAIHDCAFQDVNDNGVFDNGDTIVLSKDWIGKTVTFANPFVVPVGCDHGSTVSVGKTHVKANKITFAGSLETFPASGSPIILEANPDAHPNAGLGDGSVTITGKLLTGGQTGQFLFPDHVKNNEAIHNRTITIIARGRTLVDPGPGTCTFSHADVSVVNPQGSNDIGVHCEGDMVVRASEFSAARINMQSLTGVIDAHSVGSAGLVTLGESCDDPARNRTVGKGNDNGVVDDDDFPCALDLGSLYPGTTTFANKATLEAFCGIVTGPSKFRAYNDPLIMIAEKTLDLRGHSSTDHSGDTLLGGRYRVTLAAVAGDVLLQNTQVFHPVPVPGGAVITLASRPTSANRLDNDAEDFFGPFTGGVYNIDGACLQSLQNVRYGAPGASVVGTPEPSPCKQFPAGFTPMPNIVHAP